MATTYLWVIASLWVAVGLVVAFIMRRRGHNFYLWLALGTVLGPLIVPLAIERVRFHGVAEQDSDRIPTPPHLGFDVLVGLDGSAESVAALDAALELFGDSVTSLTIATILDYDSQSAVGGVEARQAAQEKLEAVASSIDFDSPLTKILFGRADRALAEYARTHGIELMSSGRGVTERPRPSLAASPAVLLGDVSSRCSSVPARWVQDTDREPMRRPVSPALNGGEFEGLPCQVRVVSWPL